MGVGVVASAGGVVAAAADGVESCIASFAMAAAAGAAATAAAAAASSAADGVPAGAAGVVVDAVADGLVGAGLVVVALGRGGISGVAGGSALRAIVEDSDEDSSVDFSAGVAADDASGAASGAAGSVIAKGPGVHGGAPSDGASAAVVGALDAATAGESIVTVGGCAAGDAASVSPPSPISRASGDHSLTPGGSSGSVSLIFMYRNTPTAASSVIVANGRRELTASPPDERLRERDLSGQQRRRRKLAQMTIALRIVG